MKRIRQKLHSRRGASILLALFLMLVAAMVSAVIISAAITAANRVRDDVATQEDELTITAAGRTAALLFRSQTETVKYTVDSTYKEQLFGSDPLDPDPDHLLKGLYAKAGKTGTLTVEPSPSEGMRKAIMSFTVVGPDGGGPGEYNVRGTITLEPKDGAGDPKLFLQAKFTYSSVVTHPTVYVKTWEPDPDNEGQQVEVTTPTTTQLTTETWKIESVTVSAERNKLWTE